MLDLQRGLLAQNPLYSSNPVGQINISYDTSRNIDFDFWGSSEIEFQAQTQLGDGSEAFSTPLWKMSLSKSVKNEASPLLSHYRHHGQYLSPTSRSQAIAKGRRELMEMIQDMPEPCYELSLKDIVEEQHILQEAQQEIVNEERGLNFDAKVVEVKHGKKKKKKNIKRGKILRSESMDNGAFMLKMFFPNSLGSKSKKKSVAGNCSKVSPKPSFEGCEKHVEWWKKWSLAAGNNKNSGSTSSSISRSSRQCDNNFLQGCWSFFHTKKSKSRRQRGCLL